MISLKDLDIKAEDVRAARDALASAVSAMQSEVDAIKHRHLPSIRRLVINAHAANAELSSAIEAAPELFEKPRTRVMHGIKLGYAKSKGKLEWDKPALVIKRIHKNMPDQAEVLIRVSESPSRPALAELDASSLKKLGVRISGGEDQIVLKPVDSELDKLVDSLLEDTEKEQA